MMTKTRTLLAGLSGLAAVSCAAPDGAGPGEDEMTAVPAPVARTAQGAFLGAVMEDGSVRFKGIPYAAAPVGELRFRPPQPAPVPDGIVDATAETQPACAQADLGWNGDAVEAEAFAYLAIRSLQGRPLTFPGTTGAPEPLTGGTLHRPD